MPVISLSLLFAIAALCGYGSGFGSLVEYRNADQSASVREASSQSHRHGWRGDATNGQPKGQEEAEKDRLLQAGLVTPWPRRIHNYIGHYHDQRH
ncbi:hypothetical protein MGYG_01029 [Nannizzia gypsea CBS 118893]|uniref:Secreted protein n=1 Tax=Arthroderma gypseum (strain ATCC MYA-4604 / CBS 118893) TaxID=535722 RepID=E5R3T3_ARTGP|nr:hypothetical protein MGYG_01029 [Nannizzia gypsea CBS 118893]EFQ97993.1 hypothetical protein MGYG_01029 [Nannizzia gypsea CBS 118893]